MIKVKRNKRDVCNICLETKDLSWDHVPPKSGISLSDVEIGRIFNTLTNKSETYKVFSQNGVKYRTICRDCNSIIGSEFDRTLTTFNKDLSSIIQSPILANPIRVATKPARLMRAVLGHILSAKGNIGETVFDNKIRSILFDPNAFIPEDIHLLYWIYPYDCCIIARDFAMPAKRGDMSDSIFCHVLKYFPLAFLISDKSEYEGLPNLSHFNRYFWDQEDEILINLRRIEEYNWPEKVDQGNIIFASAETQNGIIATPRVR